MDFFVLKVKQLIYLLILFNISSSEFLNKNTLISSPLFNHENFGKVHKIFYQNDKKDSNLILLSEDSFSSVNLPQKEINYRKKINKFSEIVSLEPKNLFLTQRRSNTVEVYRTETGQFVNSLEIISKNDLLYDVKTIKINELTMTIFLSFKSLTIQSKKKIIFERNLIKEDSNENSKKNKYINIIFDLYVDEENKCLLYGLKVDGKLKLYKITFDSLYKTTLSKIKKDENEEEDENNQENEEKEEKTKKKKKTENVEIEEKEIFSTESDMRIIKGLLTKNYIYIYDGRNIFGYEIGSQKMEMFGLVEQSVTLNIWSFYNEDGLIVEGRKNFYYFFKGQIYFQFDTDNHITCSISNMPLRRLYCYLDVDSSDKNLVAYWPRKEGKLEREFYTIDSLLKIYSDSNTLDFVTLLEVSPYNDKIFTLVTTNKIKEFMINKNNKVELIGEIDNTYERYVLSELFIYHRKDESNNDDIFDSYTQYQNYYTTINSIRGNINLFNILKNLVRIIIDDIIEIGKSIQRMGLNIINIINKSIEKKAFDLGREESSKENMGFLFLVTEGNLMKVLDLYTGKLLYIQQFPRNQKLKIIRENSTNQRYVSILLGKKNFFVYDLQENKFLNDAGSVINKLNLDDELLISEEQLSVIMKSFLSLIKDKPVYDLRKYKLDEKLFGPKKEKIAVYVDYEKSILYILKFYINHKNEQKLIMLHNFNFGNLISISNPKLSEDISQHYLSEGKIFYKFINNNIYYILSADLKENQKEENENSEKEKNKIKQRLILTILDGKNGKILSERVIENLDISSVRYLFEENWGLISYTKLNKGFKRNEILSFEIMNKNVDYDIVRLFKKYFFNTKKSKKSSNNNNENEIEIILKTYVIERNIKDLSLSKSKYNKGNKFVLMVFDNNDLQLIKREELSPRRPNMIMIKGKPTFDQETNSIYADKELPGYTPIVKLDPNNRFINKDKINVYDVKTVEGENESSFITCIIGDNIDCKIMHPDKLYDTLSPEFKKELLIAFTLGFIVFIFFFRKYNLKEEFKKVFLSDR